jgi:hypothetical protein
MPLPHHTYVTLELTPTAHAELRAKLVSANQEDRIFTHANAEHLDYNEIPLKSASQGGDVSDATCEEVKAAFLAAHPPLLDRMYFEGDGNPENASVVDMSGTAIKSA